MPPRAMRYALHPTNRFPAPLDPELRNAFCRGRCRRQLRIGRAHWCIDTCRPFRLALSAATRRPSQAADRRQLPQRGSQGRCRAGASDGAKAATRRLPYRLAYSHYHIRFSPILQQVFCTAAPGFVAAARQKRQFWQQSCNICIIVSIRKYFYYKKLYKMPD